MCLFNIVNKCENWLVDLVQATLLSDLTKIEKWGFYYNKILWQQYQVFTIWDEVLLQTCVDVNDITDSVTTM